jgi:uncharacterized membrane protein
MYTTTMLLTFTKLCYEAHVNIYMIMYLILREDKRLLASRTSAEMKTERTPLEIAEERYAKGELSREQFMQMKEDLQKPGT